MRQPRIPTGKALRVLRILIGAKAPLTPDDIIACGLLGKTDGIYVYLQRLEKRGFISSQKDADTRGLPGSPQRHYSITDDGRFVGELATRLQTYTFAKTLGAPRGAEKLKRSMRRLRTDREREKSTEKSKSRRRRA
jgi:DNA-binding PadR family transcriptional regulator